MNINPDLSIIVHGLFSSNTISGFQKLNQIFPESKKYIVIDKSHNNDLSIIPDNFDTVLYDDPGEFNDFGECSKNAIRQFTSIAYALDFITTKYILKIRADCILHTLKWPEGIDTIQKHEYFSYSAESYPIFAYPNLNRSPYDYGDMLILSRTESFKKLFSPYLTHGYMSLHNTNVLPNLKPLKKTCYITSEEILVINFLSRLYLCLGKGLSYDQIIIDNGSLVKPELFIRSLKLRIDIPKRISKYHSFYNVFLQRLLNKSLLLTNLYLLIRGWN